MSTDCGTTWTSVYNKQSTALGTTGLTTAAFSPTASQWRKESIGLGTYNTQNKVFVKFKATNGYGNKLYVDNINIKTTTGIQNTIIDNTLNVYPNPAKDFVVVSFSVNELLPTSINIYNALGEIVGSTFIQNMAVGVQQVKFETAHLPAGMYVAEIKSGSYSTSRKISIN